MERVAVAVRKKGLFLWLSKRRADCGGFVVQPKT